MECHVQVGERAGLAPDMTAEASMARVVLLLLLFAASARAQDADSARRDVVDIGVGVCAPVIYDESFSLVRQNGTGPALVSAYRHSKGRSTHVFENNLCLSRFRSDVPDRSYALSGIHLQERFAYRYLSTYSIGQLALSSGPSMAIDFAQIRPEGLVINNAPLHDLSIQLQLAARVAYPVDLLKRKIKIAYQLDVPVVAYNSRPDYLGFVEFSGKSRYFNQAGRYVVVNGDYFYVKNSVQVDVNADRPNHVSVNVGYYYARNNLSKPYKTLSGSVAVAYSRVFTRR
jgi:hypothetical protein